MTKKQGDRDDAREITAFKKTLPTVRNSANVLNFAEILAVDNVFYGS